MYSSKLIKYFSSVWYVIPLLLLGANTNMSSWALFHNEIEETTGVSVSLCLASQKPSEREFFVPAGTDLGVKLFLRVFQCTIL